MEAEQKAALGSQGVRETSGQGCLDLRCREVWCRLSNCSAMAQGRRHWNFTK